MSLVQVHTLFLYSMLRNKIKKYIPIVSALFLSVVMIGVALFYSSPTVNAQIGALIYRFIGGQTTGIDFTNTTLCCNGFWLGFDSVQPSNISIINGDSALWIPGFTQTYDNHNEFTQGYCSLGTIVPGPCLTVASECYSLEIVPVIQRVGTGGAQGCSGLAGGFGGVGF